MREIPQPSSEGDQVEVWKTLKEVEWRSKDRQLQERLASTPWYKNALIVGIFATAITIFGNLVVSIINHSNTLKTEKFKAEGQRVLQALQASNADQAAKNLELLREARLISGDLERKIGVYLQNRKSLNGKYLSDINGL